MHWAVHYVGKPYERGAAGPDAFDCWGLLRAVFADRKGIDLPQFAFDQGTSLREQIAQFESDQNFRAWRKCDPPLRELDVALMAQARHPSHVGVMAAGKILHAIEAGVVAMDTFALGANGFRILQWYRHERL